MNTSTNTEVLNGLATMYIAESHNLAKATTEADRERALNLVNAALCSYASLANCGLGEARDRIKATGL